MAREHIQGMIKEDENGGYIIYILDTGRGPIPDGNQPQVFHVDELILELKLR